MAKLLNFQKLLQKDSTFLGVSSGPHEGQLIVTYNSNMVMLENVRTQTRLKTWITNGKPFLSHVVHFDMKIQKFIGIFAGKYLRTWTENDDNFSKVKRIKLYRPVEAVTVADDGQVIILYKNSFCESVDSALKLVQERQLEDFSKRANGELELRDVLDVKCLNTNKYGVILHFCIRLEGNVIELNTTSLQEDTLQPVGSYKKIRIDNSSANHAHLLGCTVVEYNNEPSLISLWSNQNLFARPIFTGSTDSSLGEYIANLSFISNEYQVAMVTISGKDSPCIAFYACNSNLDGATLFIFNLQYRIVQSKQPFKVFFNAAKLDASNSYITLDAGQNLYAISYKIMLDKLINLVGSRRQADLFQQTMNTETYAAVYINPLNQNPGTNESKTQKIQDRNHSTKEKKKIEFARRDHENYSTVNERINELCSDYLSLNLTKSSQVDQLEILVASNPNEGHMFAPRFEKLVKQMETLGCSETDIVEKLLYLCIKANLNDQIIIALRRFSNMSEEIVARLLKYALETNDTTNSLDYTLLNTILSCSYHAPAMVLQIRKQLSAELIQKLLQYLYTSYTAETGQLYNLYDTFSLFDDDKKIISWVNVLIDASYQHVVLTDSQDYASILHEWHNLIKSQEEDLKNLSKLRHLIYELIRGRSIKKPTRLSSWYNVEKISLW